jgi:hypothetical protein
MRSAGPISTRAVILADAADRGLSILKHMRDPSAEDLCARWVENPDYELFCRELLPAQLTFDRSPLTRWPADIEEKLVQLTQESPAAVTILTLDGWNENSGIASSVMRSGRTWWPYRTQRCAKGWFQQPNPMRFLPSCQLLPSLPASKFPVVLASCCAKVAGSMFTIGR